MKLSLLCLGWVAALMGLSSAASAESQQSETPYCGIHLVPEVEVAPEDVARYGPGPKHRILYVRRQGGTYTGGNDDSSKNISGVINGSAALAPFDGDDTEWQELMECTRAAYAPYAIQVTDVEPPPEKPYVEIVVTATHPNQIGLPSGVAGITAGGGCNVKERGVGFAFIPTSGRGDNLCETVAHEAGHNYVLDHDEVCQDIMFFSVGGCLGTKRFLDQSSGCNDGDGPKSCRCSPNGQQNSHSVLLETFGPFDDVPPQGALTEPQDGAAVEVGFTMRAEGTDNVRVDRVEFFIDGVKVSTDTDSPFTATAPLDLEFGTHTVEARVIDGNENMAPYSATVNLAPQCATSADCSDGKICDAERCLGDVGAGCDFQGQCASGICFSDPANPSDRFCTSNCAGDSECPGGFTCQKPEFGTSKCLPDAGGGGGCCAVAGTRALSVGSTVFGGLLLGFAGLLLIRRRRR